MNSKVLLLRRVLDRRDTTAALEKNKLRLPTIGDIELQSKIMFRLRTSFDYFSSCVDILKRGKLREEMIMVSSAQFPA